MITVFNRKSVYMGMDLQKFARVREVLAQEDIDYTYKVSNPLGKWGGGHGTVRSHIGGMVGSDTYEVFVHKADYEKTMHLLRKSNTPL